MSNKISIYIKTSVIESIIPQIIDINGETLIYVIFFT